MPLSINLEEHYNYTLIEVQGKIDAITAHLLDQAIDTATREGNQHLIMDCSQLYSISSEGLRVLLNARRKLSLFHTLALCNTHRAIKSLFELSGLAQYIPLLADLEDAEAFVAQADFTMGRIKS